MAELQLKVVKNTGDGIWGKTLSNINKRVNEFKEEDGNLYAIYGTPAENLCGLQVKQFRKNRK